MELNATTREYAQLLWDEAKEQRKTDSNYVIYDVPHSNPELDFVSVNFTIHYYPKYMESAEHVNVRLVLRSKNIETKEDPYCKIYTFESTKLRRFANFTNVAEVEKELQIFYKTIHNLKFSKLLGQFYDASDERSMRKIRLLELKHQVFPNPNPNICCVCLENTETKTKCGHSLCYHCYEKLEKMTCPCCRGKIKCCDSSDDEEEDE